MSGFSINERIHEFAKKLEFASQDLEVIARHWGATDRAHLAKVAFATGDIGGAFTDMQERMQRVLRQKKELIDQMVKSVHKSARLYEQVDKDSVARFQEGR